MRIQRSRRDSRQCRQVLLLPCDAPCQAGGDSGAAGDVQEAAVDIADARDTRQFPRKEAVLNIPELPPQGKGNVPVEDERRPARIVY